MAIGTRNALFGLLGGVIGAMRVPAVIPFAKRMVRSAVRSAIRGAWELYEKGTVAMAEMGERVEDLIAEAKAEAAPRYLTQPEVLEPAAPPGSEAAAGERASTQAA